MDTDLLTDRSLTYEEERGKPMPSLNHARIQGRLFQAFVRQQGYEVLTELTLELIPGKRLVPDISVGEFGPLSLRQDVVSMRRPPASVVEILSYNQPLGEVIDKVLFYLDHGVKSVWMVVPPLRSVTIFLPDGSQKSHYAGVVCDPATGLTADLGAVFS